MAQGFPVLDSAPRGSCFLAAIAIAMLGVSSIAEAGHDDSYWSYLYRVKGEDQAHGTLGRSVRPCDWLFGGRCPESGAKPGKSSAGPPRSGAGPSDRAKADDRGRGSASQTSNSKQSTTETNGFGSAVEQMIGHCEEQATELRNASSDVVTRAIQPTVDQSNALEIFRSTAVEAADSLAATCPKGIPAPLSERLEILSQVLDEIVGSLSALRPVLVSFYTSLDDEQKARVAVSSFLASQPKSDGDSRNSYAFYDRIDPEQDAVCGYWVTALRGWPIREIARGMKLSDEQHAALHDVAAANYRAAADLLRSCPAENRLTPVGHLDAEREKMRALRHGINAIQPILAGFENTLNVDQKKSFDAMVNSFPNIRGSAP
jgi:hypothetical protein